MSRFGMSLNYYNALSNSEFPTPQEVRDAILTFDTKKCNKHASMRLDEYDVMMNNILNL